jgi:hypothetical protein
MFDWMTHPMNSDGTMKNWMAGLVLVLIVAFMWSMVVAGLEK